MKQLLRIPLLLLVFCSVAAGEVRALVCRSFRCRQKQRSSPTFAPVGHPLPLDVQLRLRCRSRGHPSARSLSSFRNGCSSLSHGDAEGMQGRSSQPARKIDHVGDVTVADVPREGLLYLPHPYVVPGGRFNEMYGWDSYFIVLGLVADHRTDLARNIIENFFSRSKTTAPSSTRIEPITSPVRQPPFSPR